MTPARSNPYPASGDLDAVESAALTAFLENAWATSGDWHQLPNSELRLRAIPNVGATCFGIFSSRNPKKRYRHEYDHKRNTRTHRIDAVVTHGEIPSGHKLPNNPEQFALMVAALVHASPDGRAPDIFSQTPVANSIDRRLFSRTVASIAEKVMEQWFGRSRRNWRGWARFFTALMGSAAFALAWWFYAVSDTLRKTCSGEDTLP